MNQHRQTFYREMGIGTRLRGLTEMLASDGDKIYSELGLNFRVSQFYAVYALMEKGPLTTAQLVNLSGFSQPAVSQTFKKLETDGFIEFVTPTDSRQKSAKLTASGLRLIERLKPIWAGISDSISDAVQESGYEFFKALDGLENAIERKGLYERVKEKQLTGQPSKSFTLEPYNIAYKQAFKDLNVRWLEAYFRVEPIDEEALGNPDGYILNSGGEIWFAIVDGKAKGCFGLKHIGDGVFEFTKYAVDPSTQGMGIGKALMQKAIDRFKERGGRKLYLETNKDLKTARHLYDSFDWVEYPQPKGSIYDRANCYMVWEGKS